MTDKSQWEGFNGTAWKKEIDVRQFIQDNYTPYDGDQTFLSGPTTATKRLWIMLQSLQKEERKKGGVLDMDTDVVSTMTSHAPGYLSKSDEQIVGLQTDKPLKRAFMPFGGIKMACEACRSYGYEPSSVLEKIFTEYHTTHNQAVFDAYTPEMKLARHNKIITGLPDTMAPPHRKPRAIGGCSTPECTTGSCVRATSGLEGTRLSGLVRVHAWSLAMW